MFCMSVFFVYFHSQRYISFLILKIAMAKNISVITVWIIIKQKLSGQNQLALSRVRELANQFLAAAKIFYSY